MLSRLVPTIALMGICAGWALPAPAWALDPDKALAEYAARVWKVRDGMPASWVRAITQSADGYLWVAGYGGVGRYGGGSITRLEPPPALQRVDDVLGAAMTLDGTLWLQPSRGRPVCVAPRAMTLDRCPGGFEALPAQVRITAFHIEPSGTLWVATGDALYRAHAGRFESIMKLAGQPFDKITALHVDAWTRLWVGTSQGLFRLEGDSLVRHTTGLGPAAAAPIAAIIASRRQPGRAHALWVASDAGLIRITDTHTELLSLTGGAPTPRTTSLLEDQHGNVWVGTTNGLARWRGRNADVFTIADGLPDRYVTALFEDREGSLWVGTREGGMAQFTDRALDAGAGPPSLRDSNVQTLCEDAGGALWAGSARGLVRWKDGVQQTYTSADGLPSSNVLAVSPGADREIWVGTSEGLARWRAGHIDVPVPVGSAVHSLYLDDTGTLWIGLRDALARLRAGRLDRFAQTKGEPAGEVRGMQRDEQGMLWASVRWRVHKLDNGTLVELLNNGASVPSTRSLYRDGEGSLWLGTAEGLFRLRAGRLTSFGGFAEAARDQLNQIIEDDHGYLWIGTMFGILRVKKPSATDGAGAEREIRLHPVLFASLDHGRGVTAARTTQPAVWKGQDGRLWFATYRGVVRVDPARMRVNTAPPPVAIEKALVDGRPARSDARNWFPPGSGSLEFAYAAITLLEPEKTLHRYWLEGWDRDWVDAGTRRAAYYTNIPPGHYRFVVQASNADGVWNTVGAAVELTLAPHVYQRGWFYALVAGALLLLGFAAYTLRLQQVRAQYGAKLAERNRVARELHDSLLQGMAAVAMQLRGLRKRLIADAGGETGPGLARQLKEIEDIVAENVEETRRVVWELREPPAEVLALPDAIADLLRKISGGQRVPCELHVEGAVAPMPPEVKLQLYRITQEAIANALKHAEPRRIDVRLIFEDHAVRLSVEDDGRGFDPERAPGAEAGRFGLLGIRERARRIGDLCVESRPGQGSKILVTVPRETSQGADA